MSDSHMYLRTSNLFGLLKRMRREEIPTLTSHLTHKLKIRATSNISSHPRFQMDSSLASNSFQEQPVFTSTPSTSQVAALCSLASSHLKPVTQVTRSLLTRNQVTIFHGLTFSLALNRLVPSLAPQPTSCFLPCYSLCVSSPPFSLCFLSEYQAFSFILTGQSCHLHRFSYYLLSEEHRGSMRIPYLPLTPDSCFQWPAGCLTFNFKIIELQGRAGIGNQ